MNDSQLQLALREWQGHLTTPAVLVAFAGVAFVLTIMVPFGTGQMFGPVGRFGYWVLITSTTYGAGALINEVIAAVFGQRWPRAKRIAVGCIASGVAVTTIVTLINWSVIGFVPDTASLPIYLFNIFAIAFVVAALFHLGVKPDAQQPALGPKILDSVPMEKRGALLALSVEDHYVSVVTSRGTHMVLIRLRDAIVQTGDAQGLQVHRSHWVATSAVKSAVREGDPALITLLNGDIIPVSRRYVAAIKKAGLI